MAVVLTLEKIRLITYGCGDAYDRGKFNPVKNARRAKPTGGLWASPVGSAFGWKEWATVEGVCDFSQSFETSYEGRTLVVDGEADLINNFLWQRAHLPFCFPDYETMLGSGVDGIYVTERGEEAVRYCYPGLYGYDCECVLVMNPNSVDGEG